MSKSFLWNFFINYFKKFYRNLYRFLPFFPFFLMFSPDIPPFFQRLLQESFRTAYICLRIFIEYSPRMHLIASPKSSPGISLDVTQEISLNFLQGFFKNFFKDSSKIFVLRICTGVSLDISLQFFQKLFRKFLLVKDFNKISSNHSSMEKSMIRIPQVFLGLFPRISPYISPSISRGMDPWTILRNPIEVLTWIQGFLYELLQRFFRFFFPRVL